MSRGVPLETGIDLSAQEQAHRRAILLGIGILMVLSLGPVFGHHLSNALANGLSGVDHVGAFCVLALHLLLTPVHEGFHVALGIGLAYASFDRCRSWSALETSLAPLQASQPEPGDRFWLAAVASGLDPARLHVVDGLPNPAFTVGLMSPKVYVASRLETLLSQPELEAVIAHEAAHVRRRDPLRVGACRFLSLTLFWLPALRRLADDVADEVEIAADDDASNGRPLVLASAILSLAGWRQQRTWRAAVGFQRDDLLNRRVLRLAGEKATPSSHVTRLSLAAAAIALFFAIASGVLVAEPIAQVAGTARNHHCAHADESALAHLFCPSLRGHSTTGKCPHSTAGS
ncbi:MAG: M56 family metallopeptidase [Nitrospirota bacterium]